VLKSVLQCVVAVAVCSCSVMGSDLRICAYVLRRAAEHCNVLQSVLQCVVALQSVAELLQCDVVCVAECGRVS